ncbi:MAG: OmpA family protein [Acetobacteraceae bacterium]
MTNHRRLLRQSDRSADDWLMTYADTITLLLCLLVVLLALVNNKRHADQQVTSPLNVEAAAVPVGIFKNSLPINDLLPAMQPDSDDDDASTEAVQVPSVPLVKKPQRTVAVISPIPVPATPETSTLESKTASAALSISLPQRIGLSPLQDAGRVEQEGRHVTTFSFNSTAFFGSGSATLSNSGEVILQDVVTDLKSEEFKDYLVTVEGHTDDAPIGTSEFPSNWELSTARAAAVVRFFLDRGIPARRLRAAGYADTFPLVSNRDANGKAIPENQAKNRRVVIALEKVEMN